MTQLDVCSPSHSTDVGILNDRERTLMKPTAAVPGHHEQSSLNLVRHRPRGRPGRGYLGMVGKIRWEGRAASW